MKKMAAGQAIQQSVSLPSKRKGELIKNQLTLSLGHLDYHRDCFLSLTQKTFDNSIIEFSVSLT